MNKFNEIEYIELSKVYEGHRVERSSKIWNYLYITILVISFILLYIIL